MKQSDRFSCLSRPENIQNISGNIFHSWRWSDGVKRFDRSFISKYEQRRPICLVCVFLYLLYTPERTHKLRWRRRSRLRWRRCTSLCSPRHSNRPDRSRYSKGPSILLHRCTLLTEGDSWEARESESVSILKSTITNNYKPVFLPNIFTILSSVGLRTHT